MNSVSQFSLEAKEPVRAYRSHYVGLSATCLPRLGNSGYRPCALSPGDPRPPSADVTARPGTPARGPGPSPAPEAGSAALRGKSQVSRGWRGGGGGGGGGCLTAWRGRGRPPLSAPARPPTGSAPSGRLRGETPLTGVAIVAQAQFWEWRELKAQELQRWQRRAKGGELGPDIYGRLEAARAGWGHLGPGRVSWSERVWTGSLVTRSGPVREAGRKSERVE